MQERFNALIYSDQLFSVHIEAMCEKKINAVVFGGWARDRINELVNSANSISNDIDMVASGEHSVVDVLGEDAIPTVFGGCGRRESTIYFDAWDLPNTYHIKRHSLDLKFETLPLTADYTFNSVIFKPAQFFGKPSIFEIGAYSAIQDKIVEFQANEVILPTIQASRAINLSVKLNFELSHTVKSFIREVCENKISLDEVLLGLERYCSSNLIAIAKAKLMNTLR
ncbi:hypothetical protein [Undibacterium sp.]|uniref:hypothetical protein n=1 Tax=Undibacterium sp. TaxID=1914977 RepID=UPI00273113B7|nr:hypothetical protein [Undibacterium sp.]MDP1980689.1 hypothetical protein [Undibacterium sp.]